MIQETQSKNRNAQNYLLSLNRAKKSANRMNKKVNQLVIGAPQKIQEFVMIGYMRKTRIHKTELTLNDFHFLKYLHDGSEGYHYFLGETVINRGRKTQQVVNKILICKLKSDA